MLRPRPKALFTRRNILLKHVAERDQALDVHNSRALEHEFRVLVINNSQEVAKEITMQLTLRLPGCSIMYAPTLELAKWLIRRRHIDLVVSCPILPDGPISKLQEALERSSTRPNLVVFGSAEASIGQLFWQSNYSLKSAAPAPSGLSRVKDLGADLRNDLNNPLQEIVALLFVAKNRDGELPPVLAQALDAIDKAAKNMAKVVSGIEERILETVPSASASGRL